MAVGWGIVAGLAAFFLVERLPMFRRDVFSRIPFLGERYSSYLKQDDDKAREEEESSQ